MRTALLSRSKVPQTQTASVRTTPAPVGGWNARDSLAHMPPEDAISLVNWFPRPSYVEVRGGYASHATGMTGNGKTLITYTGINGTNAMFCTTASGTYNVTSAGAVGASVLTRTNGKHQWVMFGDGTSNWMIACNGVDKPAYYDGTTWTAVDGGTSPALTGLTTTTLIGVAESHGRLFFIQTDTLKFWYLPAGVAGGALTSFDLAGVATRGGYLMAVGNWTVDAGDGPDDRVVFYTSEGEIIVYSGNNPSSASFWGLVGVYYAGKPIGRRCMTKLGGDLLLLTQNGTFGMNDAIASASIDHKLAISYKIEQAFTDATVLYSSVFGWEAVVYPAQAALIVNVPYAADGVHEQFVMNTITKAWCKFTSWNAETFGILNGQLYFTAGTVVYKAWTGMVDSASNIEAYGKCAFSYFGAKGAQKKFTLYRPILLVNGSLSFLTDLDVDYRDDTITGTATYSAITANVWDTAKWGTGIWGGGLDVVRQWTTPTEWEGFCAAGKLKVATNTLQIQWMANDYVFTTGGVL
jgi:hypothetical protein